MYKSFSTYLDSVRVIAALAVFFLHLPLGRVSAEAARLREFNADAVIVFFVLSGFVIAHAAQGRTLWEFAFARVTRLWTVAIPAVVLTFAADRIGMAFAPEVYARLGVEPLSVGEHLFYGASLANEWVGQQVGSNAALWSLSYEGAYYLLFAAAFFLRGAVRVAVLAISAALIGWPVLLLLPAWAVGVGVYYLLPRLPSGRWWLLVAPLPVAAYVALMAFGDVRGIGIEGMRWSSSFITAYLIAGLVALHLIAMGKGLTGEWDNRSIRAAAGASFSLYVAHLPLMTLAYALCPFGGAASVAVIAAVALAGSALFASAFERPLPAYRAALRGLLRTSATRYPAPG